MDTDWEDRLDAWEVELELNAQLEGSEWVTLERATTETGVSRAALRSWYRSGQIASRLVDGPHGMQRLVPLADVTARAEASPRLRRSAARRAAESDHIEVLRARIDRLEVRITALERHPPDHGVAGPEGGERVDSQAVVGDGRCDECDE